MIEVKNLTKKYGEHLAVDNLSFTAKKGQIIGFLGPNGAGKSTTMNMITGYISATDGSVSIGGHDIFEEPEEAKRRIGYLPEQPPLYLDMTVKEYLTFVANIKKVKRQEIESMLHKIMSMTQILDVSTRLIKHLSKGYKQRVGLAGAIVGFPDVLILDEPTVGLDPMQITQIRDLIKELSKEHTIILSSHILSEISAICDTVMIINKGKLIVSDTPDNLTKHKNNSNGLKLKVKGDKGVVCDILQTIETITKIELDEINDEVGVISLTLYSNKEHDIREDVFYALADGKCPILFMEAYTMSLEDIFLLVTGKDDNQESKLENSNTDQFETNLDKKETYSQEKNIEEEDM